MISSWSPSSAWIVRSGASFGLVQTEPDDPTVVARMPANFLDRDNTHPLGVAVERTGDDPWRTGGTGDGEVEHISQRFSACGGARRGRVHAERCRGPRDSD